MNLRVFLVLAVLFAAGHSLFAVTFVFKSGKKIEGKLVCEDSSTIRIRDTAGISMSIRKSLLDQESTAAANVRAIPVAVQMSPEIPKAASPMLPRKVYTSVPAIPLPQKAASTSSDPDRQLRKTQREFERLSHACRSAGASPSRGGILRTVTYMVHGKPVRITGYWANPSDIESAKRICNRAIQAKHEWLLAKQNWLDSQRPSTARVSFSATAK